VEVAGARLLLLRCMIVCDISTCIMAGSQRVKRVSRQASLRLLHYRGKAAYSPFCFSSLTMRTRTYEVWLLFLDMSLFSG
jgi:hypothetical protein